MAWGIEGLSFVPSTHIAPVIRGLQELSVPSYLAAREDEAIGIAGGLVLAGRKVVVLMQDNGFGNALTALATFANAYHLGLPIIANARGGPGEYNSMIHLFSEAVPDLIRALSIRVELLGPSDSGKVWEATTQSVAELACKSNRPVVLLLEMLHPSVWRPG